MASVSLRSRLTLAFAALAGTGVLAATLSMSVLVEHAIWAPLDAALREEAETLVALLDTAQHDDVGRVALQIAHETDHGPGKFVRVTAPDGHVLASSGEGPPDGSMNGVPLAGMTRSAMVGGGDRTYRVVRYGARGGGWVEVGVPAAEGVRLLGRVRLGIGATGAGLLGLLVALAWAISTRATQELDRLAGELETIEAGSLDRRLPRRRTPEVDRLAAVFNRVLSRLEAAMQHLKRFTADAAHELRTPVAALRAHLEVTLARADSVAAYRNGFLDVLEQAERLGRVAETLLTMSVVEAGERLTAQDLVPLDALVREVADALAPIAQEQGRPFTCRVAEGVTVRGSGDLLTRVVLNLLDNAFHHTPPATAVALTLGSDGDTARLEVWDAGPGISGEELPRIFERFHRGRTTSPGSGLGLALCREIVERHHGGIAVSSTSGAGTTFSVTLPLAQNG